MARISGLGYSEAADYMTNAIRSFKMEMSEATRVVDVYSAVAASSASNVTELATAMSKTASSAQAVGSSFESTTAMLAVMIEATRESPENIGSAMKSIISRYGELKENKTGIDSEGEEYSLNKVDTALQSVGISIHDAAGEFRDFDDVIFELAEHWNEIDKNTQRYIATVMAGNRQQSRFLALVSSSDRLKEEREKAENSEDASQLQFLKSLDSIDAKKQQLQTSIQSIYTSSGVQDLYKGLLDFSNQVLISFDQLSSKSGLGAAVAKIGAVFTTLATLVTTVFKTIKSQLAISAAETTAQVREAQAQELAGMADLVARKKQLLADEVKDKQQAEAEKTAIAKAEGAKQEADELKRKAKKAALRTGVGMVASTVGLGLTTRAASLDVNKDRGTKALMTGLGGVFSGIGTGAMIGGAPGAIIGALTALPGIIEAIGMAVESTEEKIARLQQNITDSQNEVLKSKDELKTLTDYKKKYEELSKTQYESADKQKEFKDLQNEIAEKYPILISSMTAEGDAVIDMADSYNVLLKAKQEVYTSNFLANLGAELAALQDIDYVLSSIYNKSPQRSHTQGVFRIKTDDYEHLNPKLQESINAQRGSEIVLNDAGYSQLTGGDLMRMFYNEEDPTLMFSDVSNTSDIGMAWRELTNGVYAAIVHQVANLGEGQELSLNQMKDKLSAENIYDNVLAASAMNEDVQSTLVSNRQASIDMINTAIANYGTDNDDYANLLAVSTADKFAADHFNNTLRAKNASYINTLNQSAVAAGETPSQLQQVAIRQSLDQQAKDFLASDLDQYFDKHDWQWYDEETKQYRRFKKGQDEGRLLEAFYTGKGVYDQNGTIKQLPNNLGINDQWYTEQLENYNYLTKDVDELYANLGKFNKSKIRDNINKLMPGNEHIEEIYNLLSEEFDAQFGDTIKRYEQWANQEITKTISDDQIRTTIQGFSTIFGPEYLQGIQDQYKTILKNTSLSDQQKSSQLSDLTAMYDLVSSIENPEIQQGILQKLQTADLTSINGIYSFIDALSSIEGLDLDAGQGKKLVDKVKELGNKIRVNITTELESYANEMETAAEGYDKALSQATNGMDLKAAKKLAEKTGKKLSDFTVKDGKFYFEDLDALNETYVIDAQERMDKLKENVKSHYSAMLGEPGSNKGFADRKQYQFSMESINQGTKKLSDLQAANDETRKSFEEQFDIDYDEFLSYYEKYQQYREDGGTSNFLKFIEDSITEETEESVKVIQSWLQQTKALSELKNGKLENFLKTTGTWKTAKDYEGIIRDQRDAQEQANKDNEALMQAIAQGNITNLPKELKVFAKNIFDARHAVISNLSNSMNNILGGKDNQLFVDDTNIQLLQELYDEGYLNKITDENNQPIENYQLKKDDIVSLTQEVINGEKSLNSWIQEHYTSGADKLKALQEYNNLIYKNTIETTTNLMNQTSSLSFDEFTNYLNDIKGFDFNNTNIYEQGGQTFTKQFQEQLDRYGLEFNKVTGRFFIKNQEEYLNGLKADIDNLGENATLEEQNAAAAKYDEGISRITNLRTEAINTLFKDYENISQADLESIANAFEVDYSTLRDTITTSNGLGGRKIDVNAVQAWLKTQKLTDAQIALYEELIGSIADDYLSNITNAMNSTIKGITSQSDIQKFVNDYSQALGYTVSSADLFQFDDILQAFTLKPEYLQKYIEKQKQEMSQQEGFN